MDVKSKLRNSLIRKIHQLSVAKLKEINSLLGKLEIQFKSKDKTLGMAGSWKNMDSDLLEGFTEKLHKNRANDRQILLP